MIPVKIASLIGAKNHRPSTNQLTIFPIIDHFNLGDDRRCDAKVQTLDLLRPKEEGIMTNLEFSRGLLKQ